MNDHATDKSVLQHIEELVSEEHGLQSAGASDASGQVGVDVVAGMYDVVEEDSNEPERSVELRDRLEPRPEAIVDPVGHARVFRERLRQLQHFGRDVDSSDMCRAALGERRHDHGVGDTIQDFGQLARVLVGHAA